MGIDLQNGYRDLLNHVGHEIELAVYGDLEEPHNVAIECMTCGCVLIDFDHPEIVDPDLAEMAYLRRIKEASRKGIDNSPCAEMK